MSNFFLVQVPQHGLMNSPSPTDLGSLPLTSSRARPSSTRLSSHSSFSTTPPCPKTSWTMAIHSKWTSWTRTTAQVSASVAWLHRIVQQIHIRSIFSPVSVAQINFCSIKSLCTFSPNVAEQSAELMETPYSLVYRCAVFHMNISLTCFLAPLTFNRKNAQRLVRERLLVQKWKTGTTNRSLCYPVFYFLKSKKASRELVKLVFPEDIRKCTFTALSSTVKSAETGDSRATL